MARIQAMRLFIGLLLAGTIAGCGGGGGAYLDTDVCEVDGLRLSSAKETQMSGGLMQSGTLEYSGSGDLKDTFNDYVASMKGLGWTIANVDIQGDRAVGTLRKDNRTCNLEFNRSDGSRLKAHIRVGTTK
jgi:hypothetical protein